MLRILAICAGSLIAVAAVGCENFDKMSAFFAIEPEVSPSNRVINAPLEQVSMTTQAQLTSLGYAATVNKTGEEVHISTKNSHGYKFDVILSSIKGKDGSEQTRARIEWEGGRDDETGMLLLSRLEGSGRKNEPTTK
jgi:hypothetical protein